MEGIALVLVTTTIKQRREFSIVCHTNFKKKSHQEFIIGGKKIGGGGPFLGKKKLGIWDFFATQTNLQLLNDEKN